MSTDTVTIAIILALLAQTFGLLRFTGEVKQALKEHERRIGVLEGGQ